MESIQYLVSLIFTIRVRRVSNSHIELIKNFNSFFFFFLFRFWDLAYPERSYVVAGSSNCPSVSYYRKIIEGTEVVQVFLLCLIDTYSAYLWVGPLGYINFMMPLTTTLS